MEAAIEASVLDSGHKREDRITYWRRAAAPPLPLHHIPEATLEKETPHVSHSNSRWLAVIMLVLVVTLSACGGSSGASATPAATPASAPVSTPAATPASATATPASATATALSSPASTQAAASCPTAATVGTALGITVSKPIGVAGGGGAQLPAGATGLACDYSGTGLNVIIELISNIDPTSISQFSSKFPVAYASVSGVGDQARSFSQPLNGGKSNEGVVATKGTTLVAITATATPASLAQIEALANQLL